MFHDRPELRLTVEHAGGEAIVHCTGDIDLVGAPLLREELRRLAEDGVARVVVDLAAVPTIDSTGLSVLVWGRRRFEELAVRGLSEVTRAVFLATGLDRSIPLR